MDMFSTENLSLSPTAASPRISFSHNLDNSLIESYPYRSDSSSDFDFCFTGDPIENEASSADELFCNGLIRPNYNEEKRLLETNSSADELFCNGLTPHNYLGQKRILVANSSTDEIFRDSPIRHDYLERKRLVVTNSSADELNCGGVARHEKSLVVATSSKHVSSSLASMDATTDQCWKQERSKEIVLNEGCDGNQSKSFWRIKRSSSLHCESTKQKSSFWSSLPLLSRSNSTGSVAKDHHNKQNPSQKQSKNSSMAVYNSSMKPPLKRNYGGAYDYGIRISPVLNVPPPFISKSAANLLGLGSFFRHSNDKNKKHSW